MTPQAPPIRTVQVIHLALIGGLLSITSVFTLLRLQSPQVAQPELTNALLLVIALTFAGGFTARQIIAKRMLAQTAEDREVAMELVREGRIPNPLFMSAILSAALAEGPGLLGAVLVFLGGPWYALVAPALSVFLIAMGMPTRTKLEEQVRGLTS